MYLKLLCNIYNLSIGKTGGIRSNLNNLLEILLNHIKRSLFDHFTY